MSRIARSGCRPANQLDRLVAATGLADDLVALLFEGFAEVHADDGLVFGDHDTQWHADQYVPASITASSAIESSDQLRHLIEQLVLARVRARRSPRRPACGARTCSRSLPWAARASNEDAGCFGDQRPDRLVLGVIAEIEQLFVDDRQFRAQRLQPGGRPWRVVARPASCPWGPRAYVAFDSQRGSAGAPRDGSRPAHGDLVNPNAPPSHAGRPSQAAQSLAAVGTDRGIRARSPARRCGPRSMPVRCGRVRSARRSASSQPLDPATSRPPRPIVVGPLARRLQHVGRHVAGGAVGHERLASAQPLGRERGDVTVAAELAQQRLGVPQHQVRLVGPAERMSGEERPTFGAFARGQRGRSCEVGRRSAMSALAIASGATRRIIRSAARKRADTTSCGVAWSHAPSMLRRTSARIEVEERRHHDVGGHRAHRRARDAK